MATPTRQLKDIAAALIDVAAHEKGLPEALMGLHHVREAFAADRQSLITLNDSALSMAHRRKALQDALKGQVSEPVVNALLVLQEASLLNELDAFSAAVTSAAKERADHRRAAVTSAVELKADERHALEKTLAEKFGGTVELVTHIDPKLIGGFVVNVDGWLFDGSIAGTCKRLASTLAS
ncbi:MAG: ATP synthase F1 subunit delta [Patescibacteria group bacterium]